MPPSHTPPGRNSLTRSPHSPLHLETLEDRTVLSAPAPVLSLSGLSVSSSYDQDHILVRFQPGATPVALAGTTMGGAVRGSAGLYKVQLGSGMSVAQAIDAYRHFARVEMAEPDYRISTSAVATGSLSNDARQADQWALKNTGRGGVAGADLDIASAWKVTTGSSKMVVSVMDTGLDYTHPDLYLNIWLNQGEIPSSRRGNLIDANGDGLITFRDLNDSRNKGQGKIADLNDNGYIDPGDVLAPMTRDSQGRDTGRGGWADRVSNDGDGYIDDLCGWNYVAGNNDVMDDLGHGTHVAGILGAMGNNGVGVAGINWNVQMMPVKFMNSSGAGSVSDFIEGLQYAVDKGARISNNSWTGANYSNALEEAIKSARDRGHIFVAAAGNYDSNNDSDPTYPAGFKVGNVVSVTATDRSDKLAKFANYGGKSVTMGAPGVDILSTTLGGGYGYNSGTSMATPQVTGVMALVWTAHPTWTYSQVIRQVTMTVDKASGLAGKTVTGGRVNAGAAVGVGQVAAPTPTDGPRITSSTPSGPSANTLSKVRVTFDRAITLSSFTAADVRFTNPNSQNIAVSAVRVVSGTGDRTFDVTFATQSAAGTYTMRIGPEVTDLRQKKMTAWTGTFRLTPPVAPPVPPRIVSSVQSGPSANTLNRVRVTFDKFVLPSTFTAADVRFTNPNGQAIAVAAVRVVVGSGDRSFDVTFATQSAAGTYTMRVGPEVTDSRQVKMTAWIGTFRLTAPPAPLRITTSTPSGPSANTLSKVRLTFDKAVAPSTFTAADVRFTNPNGQAIVVAGVRVVAGSGDRTFDVTFATQSAAGAYTMRIGPEVSDLNQVKMAAWTGTFRLTQPPAPAVPPRITTSTPSGPSANTLNRVRVTFDKSVSPSTFTVADVRFTNPNGQAIAVAGVRVVAGSGERSFDVTFATQSAAGAYTMRIGPEVTDSHQVKMTAWTGTFRLNATPPAPTSTRTYTSSVRTAVAANGRGVSLLTVTDNITVADLNVKINLSHPHLSDLYIHLQAPNGMDIVLFNRNGGPLANLANTVFDDQATVHISLGQAPFTGSFQPAVPLSNFNGISAKGAWKLWIEDRGGQNSGALTSWSLVVRPKA